MIFEISCSADLACDQKNSGASMGGGPAVFSTLVGPGWGTIWLPSLRHRGRFQREPPTKFKTQPKNVTLKNQRFQFWRWLLKTAILQGLVSSLEKALHRKSKILIKGDVSKFRYFQHACQSGADQFTYPLERCLHLACLSLSCRMADAAVLRETLYPISCATGA